MRFAILSTLALLPGLLALPTKSAELRIRDETTDSIASSVSTTNNLGGDLQKIISRIKADPLTSLSVYVDNSHTTTYNIPQELSSAFSKAISGIESLPSLPSSSNPTKEVLDDYGPLVKAVTLSVFYTTIDLKLLSQDTVGNYIPGYKEYTNNFDQQTFEFTKALDAQYVGFINELATSVGANTPLGQALKAIGGQTFYLLFDHISAHN
ncbi:hypothetical protein I302_103778 [Kwoniella bestiolae CBS 10118]|uniref:Uncharacterized protein n=1 Tax=Kwoniella bestiolae CBS 10118 TaxID=1296100 RepID=A0A1B9G9C2_9TREE|nr:hypothetical protein I302_02482 [Kwoniella bestiolae CBS 10118]OCF27638.1 hypothetical protein I302_02482 [Kwoniella bestiolae CBS 10118]